MRVLMTATGFGAPFLWAMAPLILCELDAVPTFQLSASVLMIAFIFMSLKLTIKRQWSLVKQPLQVWMVGFFVILINQAAYVYSMKLIPPEEAEIIYYLWPILLVIVSNFFLEKKGAVAPVIASILGFLGVYLLLREDEAIRSHQLDSTYVIGCISAFSAAVSWLIYSLYSKYNPSVPLEMNGMWCGLAAICCLFLHLFFETAGEISWYEFGLMSFIGVGILSLSLFLWATGMRHGYVNILSISAYLTPIISVGMLVLCGRAPYSKILLISAQLVIMGGVLCSVVEWWKERERVSN